MLHALYGPARWLPHKWDRRINLLTLGATILFLAIPSTASATVELSKERANLRALEVLEDHQIAYLFDQRPIIGWQLQRPDECQRLSSARVQCAFVVRRMRPLRMCGAKITLIRRSWYIGWRLSTHPGPRARCDTRASTAVTGRPSRRLAATVF